MRSHNLKLSGSSVKCIALVTLVLMSASGRAYGQGVKQADPKSAAVTSDSDIASRTFNQAKDLIAASNWEAAAEKLNIILTAHPNSKSYEPAIYWLARVRERQGKHQEAFLLVKKLLDEFPYSSWREDARSLRAELAAQVGNSEIIAEELRDAKSDEVKLAALSGLLRLDPQNGLRQAIDILNSESNRENRNLREGLVFLIGRYGGKQAPAILLAIAQTKTEHAVIRTAAIFALRPYVDESLLAQLTELVMNGDVAPVVEAALFIFLQQDNQWAKELLVKIATTSQLPDTRRRAANFLGKLKGGAAIDELISLYYTSEDIQVKREILSTLSKTGNPAAQAKVLEVSRLTDDMRLREEGILSLGKYGGEHVIEQLVQLYDAETREEVKRLILSSLSRSRYKSAVDKVAAVRKAGQRR